MQKKKTDVQGDEICMEGAATLYVDEKCLLESFAACLSTENLITPDEKAGLLRRIREEWK